MEKESIEISKVLTTSTAHIDKDTALLLTKWSTYGKDESPFSVKSVPYGFYIDIESVDEQKLDSMTPECIKNLIRFTNAMDCDVLCLDSDATPLSFFPTYDW